MADLNKVKFTFEEMQEQGFIDNEITENELDYTYDEYSFLQEVVIGFTDEETKASAYNNDNVYSNTAELRKYDKIPNCFVLVEKNEDNWEYTFYTDYDTAVTDLKKLDGYGLRSIEEDIKEFENKISSYNKDYLYMIDIKVNKEFNNGGHFYSYQVKYGDNLILDNQYDLDDDAFNELTETIKALDKEIEGYTIKAINKEQDSIGFNRYYEVTLTKNDFETTETVQINPLRYGQGQSRNVVELIQAELDFENLNEQYNESLNLEDNHSISLEECNRFMAENYGNLNLMDKNIFTLPEDLVVEGSLFLAKTKITKLPNNLYVKGSLYLADTLITELPKDLKVGEKIVGFVPAKKSISLEECNAIMVENNGDLDLADSLITKLPDNLHVKGNLNLSGTEITELPKGLVVDGVISLADTKVAELPEDLKANSNLWLEKSNVQKLPENLHVGGGLDLRYTKVTELPKGLQVNGDLYLDGTDITELPEDLVVEGGEIFGFEPAVKSISLEECNAIMAENDGDLDLQNTKIKKLPEDLVVEGSLWLSNSLITKLPKGLVVNGSLFLRDTKVTELPEDLVVKREIYGFEMINEKSDNIVVPEHNGSWYVIETETYFNTRYFLCEHEEYGDETANIIINERGNLIADEVYSFDDVDVNRYFPNEQIKNISLDLCNQLMAENRGDLDLYNTKVVTLPEDLVVYGYLNLKNSKVEKLPDGLKVNGSLLLDNTNIAELPKGLQVGGNLTLAGTKITELPEDLYVEGALFLDNTNIAELPKGLVINKGLWLTDSLITTLPDALDVGGDLFLGNSKVTELPKGLYVGGNLNLRYSKVEKLPEGLCVVKNLDLTDSKIEKLPDGLRVGGEIIGFEPTVNSETKINEDVFLPKNYQKIIEYNGYVLAVNKQHSMGEEYVVWSIDYDRKGVSLGSYFTNNEQGAAKRFAVRSGMVDVNTVFEKDELVEIYKCIQDTLCEDYNISNEEKENIKNIACKIEDAVPDIENIIKNDIEKGQAEQQYEVNEMDVDFEM